MTAVCLSIAVEIQTKIRICFISSHYCYC